MRGITYLLKDFLLVNGLALKTDLVYADGNRQYYKESNVDIFIYTIHLISFNH